MYFPQDPIECGNVDCRGRKSFTHKSPRNSSTSRDIQCSHPSECAFQGSFPPLQKLINYHQSPSSIDEKYLVLFLPKHHDKSNQLVFDLKVHDFKVIYTIIVCSHPSVDHAQAKNCAHGHTSLQSKLLIFRRKKT